jgi:hypothetical protein
MDAAVRSALLILASVASLSTEQGVLMEVPLRNDCKTVVKMFRGNSWRCLIRKLEYIESPFKKDENF